MESAMGEGGKVLYLVVVDDGEKRKKGGGGKYSFRYARPLLQSTLQLMGCKACHAFEISQRDFEMMRNETSVESLVPKTDDLLPAKGGLKDDGVEKDNLRKRRTF